MESKPTLREYTTPRKSEILG